jgi:hypothetical protein
MAQHYRKESAIDLKDLLARFDCQRVPANLLCYEKFAHLYRGAEAAEIDNARQRNGFIALAADNSRGGLCGV